MASGKRGPSVLVTDSRDRPARSGARASPWQRQSGPSTISSSSQGTRLLTVDNVLQFTSDIPSGRPRPGPQLPLRPATVDDTDGSVLASPRNSRPLSDEIGTAGATGTGTNPLGFAGGGTGGISSVAGLQSRSGQPLPSRTTKISEKLVFLPDPTPSRGNRSSQGDDDDEHNDDGSDDRTTRLGGEDRRLLEEMEADEATGPLRDEELDVLRKRRGVRGKSYAERLPKSQRAEQQLPRVTAYCTAQAFKVTETADFLRKRHEVRTKIYDDCLYVIYAIPLLPGTDGFRLRSRPILRAPGSAKTVLDLEIERSERRDHHEDYFFDYQGSSKPDSSPASVVTSSEGKATHLHPDRGDQAEAGQSFDGADAPPPTPPGRLPSEAKDSFAEMFVFSYGVVVFWNFSEYQEKDILADMTFAEVVKPSGSFSGGDPSGQQRQHQRQHPAESRPGSGSVDGGDLGPPGWKSLMVRPLDLADFEMEEFHFEYSADVRRPRVFNDMITLLPRSDHMIKLTISHAIAQSTKLCFFEARMLETTMSAQNVPRDLALTGKLNMTRTEIVKILGRLFKSRVDINLSSNILDVPSFFWDSEPTLHPLYVAIRDYLEIQARTRLLNERCRVFLDLAEILSDSVADAKMSTITWIIILLIVVSIIVTVTEVALRFGLLHGKRTPLPVYAPASSSVFAPLALGLPHSVALDDLRRWLGSMTDEQRRDVCGHPGLAFGGL